MSFSLATSRRYRDNNGEQKEDTGTTSWLPELADLEQLVEQGNDASTWKDASRQAGRTRTDRSVHTEVALDVPDLTPAETDKANGNGRRQRSNSFQNEYDQQQADDCAELPF